MDPLHFDWNEKVVYSPGGPQPQIILENDKIKLIVAGLEAGQKIPVHPEALGVYHILEGRGWIIIDEQRIPIHPGLTVVAPQGAARGIEAETRLAFLATRVA